MSTKENDNDDQRVRRFYIASDTETDSDTESESEEEVLTEKEKLAKIEFDKQFEKCRDKPMTENPEFAIAYQTRLIGELAGQNSDLMGDIRDADETNRILRNRISYYKKIIAQLLTPNSVPMTELTYAKQFEPKRPKRVKKPKKVKETTKVDETKMVEEIPKKAKTQKKEPKKPTAKKPTAKKPAAKKPAVKKTADKNSKESKSKTEPAKKRGRPPKKTTNA